MKDNLILLRQLFLFGIVGGIGFIVDAGILHITKPVLGIYWGRGLSFISAVFATWVLNRNITFKTDKKTSLFKEFLFYLWCMLFGGIANLLSYYILIHYFLLVAENPTIGVAIGSIAGMFVNFVTSKFLVFK